MATRKKKASPKKKGPGRPVKLTDELQEELCKRLMLGCYIEQAAASCGIAKDTIYAWLKAGKRGESYGRLSKARMRRFSDAVEKAQGDFETIALKQIYDAASGGDWHAAAWRLERKHPKRWGKRTGVDLTSGGEKIAPVQVFTPRADLAELMGGGEDEDD